MRAPASNQKVSVPRFPTLMVVIASILTCIFLMWLGIYSVNSSYKLKQKITMSLHALEVRGVIMQLHEVLSMSARMYISTGDKKWLNQFNYFDPLLNNLVEEASLILQTPDLQTLMSQTEDANKQLDTMEQQAFLLVKEGNFSAAKQILFSHPYEVQKNLYASAMEKYGKYLKNQARQQINDQFKRISYIIMILTIGFLASLIAWSFAFRSIRNWKKLLTTIMINELNYKKDLEDSRVLLEERVRERTDELEVLNQSLKNNEMNLTNINKALKESESRFHLAIESTPVGMAILSLDGQFKEINQALCDLFGYRKEEILKKTSQDVTYPSDYNKEKELIEKLSHDEIKSFQIDKRYIHKHGYVFWALLNASLLKNQNKESQIICQIQDISNRKKYEKEILELNERMSTALNDLKQHDNEMGLLNKMNEMLQSCQTSHEAYSIINACAHEIFAAQEISGGLAIFDPNTQMMELVGSGGQYPNLKKIFSVDDCWSLRMGHNYLIEKPKEHLICSHFTTLPLGGYICVPLIVRNNIIGVVNQTAPKNSSISKSQKQLCIAFSDIIKLSLANIKLRENLEAQSIRDPLTELFNRRYLNDILPRELKRTERNHETLTVAMLDIDHFKEINDQYGHEMGDDILKVVSKTLLKNFRGTDIVCRFGGDEFVVILFEKNSTNPISKFQALQTDIQHIQMNPLHHSMQITLSIGIAQAPIHGTTSEEILQAADHALYAAKKTGKNKIEIFQNRKNS